MSRAPCLRSLVKIKFVLWLQKISKLLMSRRFNIGLSARPWSSNKHQSAMNIPLRQNVERITLPKCNSFALYSDGSAFMVSDINPPFGVPLGRLFFLVYGTYLRRSYRNRAGVVLTHDCELSRWWERVTKHSRKDWFGQPLNPSSWESNRRRVSDYTGD